MRFTQEDYRSIEQWLKHRSIKDIDFPSASKLTGLDNVTVIQDNKNKIATIKQIADTISKMSFNHFYNVSGTENKYYISILEAASLVPVEARRLGLVITFYTKNNNWQIYQFRGDSLNKWGEEASWVNIVQETLDELIPIPDEEDIEGVLKGNSIAFRLKDKIYNLQEYSGKGRVILRKNMVLSNNSGIPGVDISDDPDGMTNVLTQEMVSQDNTVYIIQYDYSLEGKTVKIPDNCVLMFLGGSLNNGTIDLNGAQVTGLLKPVLGTVSVTGKYAEGQVFYRNGKLLVQGQNSFDTLVTDTALQQISNSVSTAVDNANTALNSVNSVISTVENIVLQAILDNITVSINGGTPVEPDSKGNIDVIVQPLTIKHREGEDVISDTYNGKVATTINTSDFTILNGAASTNNVVSRYNPFNIVGGQVTVHPLKFAVNGTPYAYSPLSSLPLIDFDNLPINRVLFSGTIEQEDGTFLAKGTYLSGVSSGLSTPVNTKTLIFTLFGCTVTGVTVSSCVEDPVNDTLHPTSIIRSSVNTDKTAITIDSVRPSIDADEGGKVLNLQTLGTEVKKFNIIVTGYKNNG